MMLPDENMDRRLARFRLRPAPEGLKAKILTECRRRSAEGAGRSMTPRLRIILAVECLALFLLLVVIPGRTAKGKYAGIFVSPGIGETAASSLSSEVEIVGEASGLSTAEKARLVRRLSLGRAEEPRRQRPSLSKDLEDYHEN